MADVKGDLAGHEPGRRDVAEVRGAARSSSASTRRRSPAVPTVFWDVFGEQGHPVRATVSDMGPLLLARILNLNDTQEGVLTLVFKIADDNGLLLLDLKDLRALLQYVGDNARSSRPTTATSRRRRSAPSSAACCTLEQQGGDRFLGEPMLNVDDLLQTDGGRGVVNILAADKLMQLAEALLDAAAVAALRALRAPARGRRSATSRSSSSSSTRRTCCSPTRRRRCSRRSSRSCA